MREFWSGCGGAVLAFFAVVVIVIAMMLTAATLTGIGWGWQWITAEIRGSVGAREKITADPNFRIQAYQSFFEQCSSIQALERDIEEQQKLLEIIQDPQRREIIQLNVASITGARNGAVDRYNQNALKNWTEGQFRDNDLPYQIPTTYRTGVRTICAVQ